MWLHIERLLTIITGASPQAPMHCGLFMFGRVFGNFPSEFLEGFSGKH
jgi:hypothetical protein